MTCASVSPLWLYIKILQIILMIPIGNRSTWLRLYLSPFSFTLYIDSEKILRHRVSSHLLNLWFVTLIFTNVAVLSYITADVLVGQKVVINHLQDILRFDNLKYIARELESDALHDFFKVCCNTRLISLLTYKSRFFYNNQTMPLIV